MPALILVHIGNHFPEYINDCICQIQRVTKIDIHVLINRIHLSKIATNTTVVPLEDIPSSSYRDEFEKKSRLNSSFRNGFWKFAMMRFFYIYEYMAFKGLTDIFHIENDILIYMDFLAFLEKFQEKQMWCVMDSDRRCVPSFLYFKNKEILEKLLNTCVQQSSSNVSDMFALGKFRNENTSAVGNLPIIGSYVDPIDPMFSEHASKFQCIFDAAAVGQYIGGVDPKNDPKDSTGFINEVCPFKCNKVTIEWKDTKPYLNGMPLVNLHIHSKNLKKWM